MAARFQPGGAEVVGGTAEFVRASPRIFAPLQHRSAEGSGGPKPAPPRFFTKYTIDFLPGLSDLCPTPHSNMSPMKISGLFSLLVLSLAGVAVAAEPPTAPPTEVVILDHAKVDDAFAKGLPLLINSRYKVQAGRRVVGGEVEYHEHDTDLLYFIEGEATMVTGGKMVEQRTTGTGEIRAKDITGGVTRHLAKGDIIVIPAGVPHWFKEVKGTCLYYVVKVTQ
jgi:mannose-6-phosphate isomerase-like protein (cupin superfamily)